LIEGLKNTLFPGRASGYLEAAKKGELEGSARPKHIAEALRSKVGGSRQSFRQSEKESFAQKIAQEEEGKQIQEEGKQMQEENIPMFEDYQSSLEQLEQTYKSYEK